MMVVMMAVGCSSEPSGYSGSDAGDPQLDAGDEEDVDGENGRDDVGEPDTGGADTGDLDTGEPDAGEPDTGEPDTGDPDTGTPDVGEPDTGEPNGEVNCDERPSLSEHPEWSVATDVIVGNDNPDPNDYTEVFPGDEFPGTNNNFPFYLEKGRYAAMEFTVPPDLDQRGGWRIAPFTNQPTIGSGLGFITLTKCPGDFDVTTFDRPECAGIADTSEGWLMPRWTTDPNDPQIHQRCYLEPGETYFMNLAFVAGLDETDYPPTQHDCQDRPSCGYHMQRGVD